MSGRKSKENVSTSSMSASAATTTSSGANQPKQCIAQNFLLIWVDSNIDESTQDCQNTLAQLRSIVNDINIFTKRDDAVDFLTEVHGMNAFLIVEGTLGQHILPFIHDIPQLDAIYLFCNNESGHEQWTKEWVKIKGVHTDIKPICEALELSAKQCNQDSIAVSFVTVNEGAPIQNLNQLDPSFMYTKIFKEILLEIKHDEKSIKDLANYCRKLFTDNMRELNIIHELECNYRSKSPIWWYTRECFTYQMLNRALRTLESDIIINMGFFIRDLHQQIQELYQKKIGTYRGKSFIVYRGQGLLKADFEKIVKTKGGLMSFNNFLSTSENRDVSLRFATRTLGKIDLVGILFKMSIDPSVSSAPFASIREVSYYNTEEEVLFSMHSVFRIGEINKMDNNDSLYQVDLTLTADDDQQLRTLTECIRKEVQGATGWQRLGQLLVKLSQFDKAEELYSVLLEQTSYEVDKQHYYHQLGYIKEDQGDYKKAIEYYEKGLAILEKNVPPNHSSLATSYNNIGSVYDKMEEYSKALSFCEKAREIFEKTLLPNDPFLATSYNNSGTLYKNMGEYSKALLFYKKALDIRRKILPPNHPSLATSYNNIGSVYDKMRQYVKALSFYEKAREIFEKALLPNNPLLATSYSNIGVVYYNMEEYTKAISFFEKNLDIHRKTLPPNHPSLATSYDSIGSVYDKIGEYSKALSFYEKALEIYEKSLPPNHSSLADACKNISVVYAKMTDYSKSLSYLERALDIRQRSLPPNHPDIQDDRRNIEIVKMILQTYI